MKPQAIFLFFFAVLTSGLVYSQDVEELLVKAQAFRQEKNYDSAIYLLKRGSQLDPADARFYFRLGIIYFDLKERDSAMRYFRKEFTMYPSSAGSMYNYGILKYQVGQTDSAIYYYRKVVAINPNFKGGYQNIAA